MDRSEILGVFLLIIILFAAGVLVVKSLVRGTKLMTAPADRTEMTGYYTLILFGRTHGNDLETVAILDKEDDHYSIEPHAPDFRFRTEKKVPAARALQKAEEFVKMHPSFHQHRTSKIMDEKGVAIGYEIRPLYYPEAFGSPDVLDISYMLKDNKVTVYIKLTPSAEKIQNQQSGP